MISCVNCTKCSKHFTAGKPETLERKEDGRFAYNGLVSANLRQPSGQVWEDFTQDVIDSFSDPRFDGFGKVTEANQVRTFNHNMNDHYLSPLLSSNAIY